MYHGRALPVDIVVFRTRRSIADLVRILDHEPGWRLSSHAHDHQIEYESGGRLAASVQGSLEATVDDPD